MTQCPDRYVMRADRRLSGLLVRLCGLFDVASAMNCVDTLTTAVSLDLRSVSLLEALRTRTRHHLDQLKYRSSRSVFLSLLRSVTAIDALGEQCVASWWFTIVDDFNVAHLHNWDMIVEFVFHIVPQLESLSTEVLVVASFPRKRLSRC